MIKYRIIKETKEKSKKVRYYLERHWKFLYWSGWKKVEEYDPLCGSSYPIIFNSREEVQEHYDKIIEKTIVEIIEIKHE